MSEMATSCVQFAMAMLPRVQRVLRGSRIGQPVDLVCTGEFARQRAAEAQRAEVPGPRATYVKLTQEEIDYIRAHTGEPAWRVANALGVHMSSVYKVWRAENPRPAISEQGRPRTRGVRNRPGSNQRALRPGEAETEGER
jgi:hypothetical protein